MDLNRMVQTTFTANTAGFNRQVTQMSGVASSAGSSLSMLSGSLAPIAAGLGALAAGLAGVVSLKEIAAVGSAAEDANIQIAGFLTAIGKAGTYDEGLKQAASTMRAITVAAAALPGEAEDYIRVFKAGVVVVGNAMHGSIKDVYTFTNQYAAVASTLGVDSEQAARDIQKLLQAGKGAAGQHLRTWQQMLNLAKGMPGYADLTQEKFNAMTPEKRLQTLQGIMKGLQPMLDKSATSWSALIGAFESNSRMLLREATGPLFEGMKEGLGAFNSLLIDADGKWTELGKTITSIGTILSTQVVGAVKEIVGYTGKIVQDLKGAAKAWMDTAGAKSLSSALSGLGNRTQMMSATMGPKRMAAGGAALAGGILGQDPLIGALVGGFINYIGREGALTKMMDAGSAALASVVKVLGPLWNYASRVSDVFGDMFENVLPPVLDLLNAIIAPMATFAGHIIDLATVVWTKVRPSLYELWAAGGAVITQLRLALGPAIKSTSQAMLVFYRWAVQVLVPIIIAVVKYMVVAVTQLAQVIEFVAKLMGKVFGTPTEEGETGTDIFGDILKAIDKQNRQDDLEFEKEKKSGMDQRPTAETYQDFRGSKFDITQKFAEGFDPDRVAIAIASDLSRIGDERLQSGFEPIFAVR